MPNDLSVRSHPEIFVVGDTAHLERDGKPLPGIVQVAMQEGRCAGTLIRNRIAGVGTTLRSADTADDPRLPIGPPAGD